MLQISNLLGAKKEKYIMLTFDYQVLNIEDMIKEKEMMEKYKIGDFYMKEEPKGGENGHIILLKT